MIEKKNQKKTKQAFFLFLNVKRWISPEKKEIRFPDLPLLSFDLEKSFCRAEILKKHTHKQTVGFWVCLFVF